MQLYIIEKLVLLATPCGNSSIFLQRVDGIANLKTIRKFFNQKY
jgi:hypothetical protein